MHSTTPAVDFSKETLVVKEEETYDAGVSERVEAEVVKLLKEPQSLLGEAIPRIVNVCQYRSLFLFYSILLKINS